MTHASLFSGIGGPEVAAAMLGWSNLFHCEINSFGRKVLEYWFPESISYEDITKTDFREWRGRVDVLTGGFPCQPFSYAGKRGGRDDERYLWPEMLRAINEIRPTWVVGENVAGITTMVEGGILADMGSESTLFGEVDGFYRYGLRQTFTLEQICKDLEGCGYSVQPMLVPAAAVGAPHRRDRIFIIAYATNTNGCNDVRVSPSVQSQSGAERVQERNGIREPGISDKIRPKVRRVAKDSLSDGCLDGEDEEQRNKWDVGNAGTGDIERLRAEERVYRASASDTDLQRFHQCLNTYFARKEGGQHSEAYCDRADTFGLYPEERWAGFPTVSSVHRGNDGLPFPLDDLAIPQTRWRFESLKAYGNAIVPQVMYRIFGAIQKINQSAENE